MMVINMSLNLRVAKSEYERCENCKNFYAIFVKAKWYGKYLINGRCHNEKTKTFGYCADYMTCDLFEKKVI